MSKYEPLWIYIKKHDCKQLSYSDIEKICGFKIDHSFLTYKKELLEYGYYVNKISMKQEIVQFVKQAQNM